MFFRSKRQKVSNLPKGSNYPLPPEAKMPELKKVNYPVQELVDKYKDTDKLRVKWIPGTSRFYFPDRWFTSGSALSSVKIFILRDADLEILFTFTQSYGCDSYQVSIKGFDVGLTGEEQEYLYTNIAARWEDRMVALYKIKKVWKETAERNRLGELLK